MKNLVKTTRGTSTHSRTRQRSRRRTNPGVKGWQKKERKALKVARRVDSEEKRGHENIQYMLDFLASADIYTLRNDGIDNARKLQRLLEAYHSDEIFDAEFPQKSIESFRNEKGKALPSLDGDRREYFRRRTLSLCAGKLYDMLRGSSFMKTLSYGSSSGTSAIYEKAFKTAVSVAYPERAANAFQYVTAGLPKIGASAASA